MSDWDFLYDMHNEGYSPEEIADAATLGYAPWESNYIDSDWVDSQLNDQPLENILSIKPLSPYVSREGFPYSHLEQAEIFHELVECAIRHFENTGRYLQIWGELGEIYAEIKFGLRRHESFKAGSDGFIGNKLVEVKTISPEKTNDTVLVKSKGDFEQVLIVRINKEFKFQGKLFERSELSGNAGKFLKGDLNKII